MNRRNPRPEGPVMYPPPSPHVGTEIGRRVQALHDAAGDLIAKVAGALDETNPLYEATGPAARPILQKLHDGPCFRRLVAEHAAMLAAVRQADPDFYRELTGQKGEQSHDAT